MKRLSYRAKRFYQKKIIPYIRKELGIDELEDNIYTLLNHAADITMCRPAEGNLRAVQLAGTELLKLFDSVCRKESLTYWLDWGTLLGAVRHKGFVPWDDDLDVCMPREDYQRAIPILTKYFSEVEGYDVKNSEEAERTWFWISNWDVGIHLDVFPIDHFLIGKGASQKEIYEAVAACRGTGEPPMEKKGDPHEMDTVYYYLSLIWNRSEYFCHDTVFPLKETAFEAYRFFVPNDCERYLSKEYGNYMEFPRSRILSHRDLLNPSEETGAMIENTIKILKEKQAEMMRSE